MPHSNYGDRDRDNRGDSYRDRGDYRDQRQPRPDRYADYQDRGRGYADRRQPVGYRPAYDNPPPYSPPQPPPAKKRRWPLWAALAVAGVVLVSCVAAVASSSGGGGTGTAGASATSGAGAGGSAAQGMFQHPEDVTVSSCANDDLGMMAAQIVVHNTSSKASNYSIQIAFQSVDGTQKYGDGYAVINTLAAGQQEPEKVQSFTQAPGQYKCVVISAQRTQAI